MALQCSAQEHSALSYTLWLQALHANSSARDPNIWEGSGPRNRIHNYQLTGFDIFCYICKISFQWCNPCRFMVEVLSAITHQEGERLPQWLWTTGTMSYSNRVTDTSQPWEKSHTFLSVSFHVHIWALVTTVSWRTSVRRKGIEKGTKVLPAAQPWHFGLGINWQKDPQCCLG